MSIDELGRAAATEARGRATDTVAPGAMLASLHRTRRVRSVATLIGVAVCLAGISVLGTAVLTGRSTASHDVTPGTSIPPASADPVCADPMVSCLADGRLRVSLGVPVTVTPPADFVTELNTFGTQTVEGYRNDVDQTGVTVIENAIPVRNGPRWAADPTGGTTAHAMAVWLQHRPFLAHTSIKSVAVSGLTGWRVVGELKPGTLLRASKGGFYVSPTFKADDGATAGYGADLIGDYTLVDVPGAGVTVIWSWTLQPDRGVLADNQPFIDSLSFG